MPLQTRYDQLGEWITPLSSIQEVIGLRAQGSLQFPLVPPVGPAAEEQGLLQPGLGLYMYSRTSETHAVESAEWQRTLAVKLAERQLWGCFNDVQFPSPRLWLLECSAQLPPCSPDLLRGLMHAESSTLFFSADPAWEVFPLRVLSEAAIDEWSESCHGGFCRRAESEPLVTTLSESCAWEQLPAEAIMHDQLSQEQLLVEFVRAGRVLTKQKMRERQIYLAAKFKSVSPSEGFFGDRLPVETDPVGPEAVVSRWQLYKAQAVAAVLALQQEGEHVTTFPAAGRWPGPPVSSLWARRCWAKLGSRILERDRQKARKLAGDVEDLFKSSARSSMSTPETTAAGISSLNLSSYMTVSSFAESMAYDVSVQWTPRSSRPSVKLCQSGLVAQMIGRYGG